MSNEINVRDVLKGSFKIILSKPVILLPMIFLVLFDRLQGYLASKYIDIPDKIGSIADLMPVLPSILAYFIIYLIIFIVINIIIEGIYTVTIKNILENKEVDLATASGLASKKAFVLIAAGILLGFMIIAGTLFFIIPGMLFAIWYFYTIPFIMLENRGVLDGMKASKEFAHNKKSMTIYFMIVPFVFLFLGSSIAGVVFYRVPIAYYAINVVLDTVIYTWYSVIPAYVYLKEFGVKTQSHKIGK
ncbi:MAG: hypothetical protein FIB07_17925 [Candidatus Methanoperedens sp.]|nr:hypothetical protein [Candidatus Methanoperedens sp.]